MTACTGLAILSILLARKPQTTELDREILFRSYQYVDTLGSRPFDALSTEDKLTLLHSYYNIKDYSSTIETGESMAEELRALPKERQKPFIGMMEAAYRKLGKSKEASAFRSQF